MQGIEVPIAYNENNERGKVCSKCDTWKPLTEYHKDASVKNGFTSQCRSCRKEYQESYRQTDNGKRKRRVQKWQRDFKIKNEYGNYFTWDDYERWFTGYCDCCGTDDPQGQNGVFVLDHDHETGFVRGILCQLCNGGNNWDKRNKAGERISALMTEYLIVADIRIATYPLKHKYFWEG